MKLGSNYDMVSWMQFFLSDQLIKLIIKFETKIKRQACSIIRIYHKTLIANSISGSSLISAYIIRAFQQKCYVDKIFTQLDLISIKRVLSICQNLVEHQIDQT